MNKYLYCGKWWCEKCDHELTETVIKYKNWVCPNCGHKEKGN